MNPLRNGSVSILVAAVAVFAACASGTERQLPQEPTITAGVVPQPTPSLLRQAPAITDGRRNLDVSAPGARALIDIVETASVPELLDRTSMQTNACDSLGSRGVTLCQQLGIANGTTVQTMRPEGYEVDLLRKDVEASLTYFLAGRHPRVQLIGRRDDGAYMLSFAIDPRPGLVFPGAIEEGGADVGTWYAVTEPANPGKVATYGYRPVGSPPLEFVRFEQFHGTHGYTILGASDEFKGAEQLSHDAREKANRTP